MPNAFYSFLSSDWAGLIMALPIALAGFVLLRAGLSANPGIMRWSIAGVGGLILLVGSMLTASSAFRGAASSWKQSRHEPPGQLVDVGGFRMHMLAEGDNRGNPTLVWIPGAHQAGIFLHHFHREFREETRSILFDRAGTGWSDVGPYPRTTSREIDEFHRMLETAGEAGPIVLIGHSYGGMFAFNYALRYPDSVAGLILLDPGVAQLYQNPQAAHFMRQMARNTLMMSLLATFGIPVHWLSPNADAIEQATKVYKEVLSDVWTVAQDMEVAAKGLYSAASIFTEIDTEEFFTEGLARPGVLDGTPAMCVTFLGGDDLDSTYAFDYAKSLTGQDDPEFIQGQLDGLGKTRTHIRSISDQMITYSTPEGLTHSFPYERPEFVSKLVRNMMTWIQTGLPPDDD